MSESRPQITDAYLELYVADAGPAVDYYTRGLLFDQVAISDGSLRRSRLLRSADAQVIITEPTGPDGAVADWLARHGDGVADIALRTDDLPGLVDSAKQAGVPVLQPIRLVSVEGTCAARISGAGSVHHTLISAARDLAEWPPGFTWTAHRDTRQLRLPMPGSGVARARPRAIDHLAWCLPAGALEATAARYQQALGLQIISSEQIIAGTSVANSFALQAPGPDPGLTFVLTEPDRVSQPVPGGQIDDFLDAHGGGGVQHIAHRVDDIVTAVRAQSQGGVQFLPTPPAYYHRLPDRVTGDPAIRTRLQELQDTNVLVDHDDDGLLFQIFTAAPHQPPTLFYELIQRAGSLGFGQANVRALFEARARALPTGTAPGTRQ